MYELSEVLELVAECDVVRIRVIHTLPVRNVMKPRTYSDPSVTSSK